MNFDRQKLFTTAVLGIRKQGGPAFNPQTGACRYRTETGRACAIGHSIPDDEYDAELEGNNPYCREVRQALGFKMPPDNDNLRFLSLMQRRIHDEIVDTVKDDAAFMLLFEEAVRCFAAEYDLKVPS